jgi:hypothetical protein
VELARRSGSYQPSGLTIAAASAVFAISYVAKLNGEDEHWQHAQSACSPRIDACRFTVLVRMGSPPSHNTALRP